ncbi:MAG TPA: hypothetical protein VEV19_04795 [Ktedonobacteraceae bacterium]|nr:hypothetical protein [Ktedonobacteraceae bacterium]
MSVTVDWLSATTQKVLYWLRTGISSTFSSSPEEVRIALDLLTQHYVRVVWLISHRLPLAQFAGGVTLTRGRAALTVYFQIGDW